LAPGFLLLPAEGGWVYDLKFHFGRIFVEMIIFSERKEL
jgi:hypothetical protein